MNLWQKISLTSLRWALGWLFLYAGVSKIANPEWSALAYLKGAHSFPGLYVWLAQDSIVPWVNVINEWGLFLLGVSLIVGIGIRLSAPAGMMLMALYYLPISQFPHPSASAYIVDQHIIFMLLLWTLWQFNEHIPWKVSCCLESVSWFQKMRLLQ